MLSWRDAIDTGKFLVDLRGRYNLAAWEARLKDEERRQQIERERLERLEKIARLDLELLGAKLGTRVERVHSYWERQDSLARVQLIIVLENWTVYDLVCDRLTGTVARSEGPKRGARWRCRPAAMRTTIAWPIMAVPATLAH